MDRAKEERQAHTLTALDYFGLVPDRPPVEAISLFHLWPENVEPFDLFCSMHTQWLRSGGIETGLPDALLRQCVADNRPKGHRRSAVRKRQELMHLLLAAEQGALKGFRQAAQAAREEQSRQR